MGVLMARWFLRINFVARNVRVKSLRGRALRQVNVRAFKRSSGEPRTHFRGSADTRRYPRMPLEAAVMGPPLVIYYISMGGKRMG